MDLIFTLGNLVVWLIVSIFAFLKFIDKFFDLLPNLSKHKDNTIVWLGDFFNYRKFKKIALKNDIQKIVNEIVFFGRRRVAQGVD